MGASTKQRFQSLHWIMCAENGGCVVVPVLHTMKSAAISSLHCAGHNARRIPGLSDRAVAEGSKAMLCYASSPPVAFHREISTLALPTLRHGNVIAAK